MIFAPHKINRPALGMSMRVSWNEIEDAFNFANSGQPGEVEVFLCKETGKTYIRSVVIDVPEEVPEDLDECDKYFKVPHKQHLGLGKRVALDFASECLPGAFDKVRDIFSRSGAYKRFKSFLRFHGAMDRWHDFSNKAEGAALRE